MVTTAAQIRQQGRISSFQSQIRSQQEQSQRQVEEASRQISAQQEALKKREAQLKKLSIKPTRRQLAGRGRAGLVKQTLAQQRLEKVIAKEQAKISTARESLSTARGKLVSQAKDISGKFPTAFKQIEKARKGVAALPKGILLAFKDPVTGEKFSFPSGEAPEDFIPVGVDVRGEEFSTQGLLDVGVDIKEIAFPTKTLQELIAPASLQAKDLVKRLEEGIKSGKITTIPRGTLISRFGKDVGSQIDKGLRASLDRPISKAATKVFDLLEKRGISKEDIANIISISPDKIDRHILTRNLPKHGKDSLKELLAFERGAVLGALKEIEEKPEEIVLTAAAGYAIPGVLARFAGLKLVKNIPTNIKKKGASAISKFLGTSYVTSAGLRVAGEPTVEEKGKVFGGILTSEVAPFMVGTRLGVQGLLRKEIKKELNLELAKLTPEKRLAFEEYMKQAELLGKFEPKTSNIKLDNIESIPDKNAQVAIRKFLKNNKNEVIVGGSVAQTGQVKVQRKLGDMDLYLEGKLNPNQAAKQLADALKKAGVQRVSNVRGQITIAGKKAIEFHDIDRLLVNIKQVIPNWKSATSYIIKTPEGIKIQRIGVQARRKLVAAFADPKRFATGKYQKDLKDFKTIADKLFKRAELNARESYFFREQKIKKIEKVFGKTISRKEPKIPKLFEEKKAFVKKKITITGDSPLIKRAKIIAQTKAFSRRIKSPIPSPSPKIVRKSTFIKLSKRGKSPLIKRTESLASQKPFSKKIKRLVLPSQLGVKRKAPPSQVPFKPKKPTKIFPSQFPVKPRKIPPSQPPTKLPIIRVPTPFVPPSQPPVKPSVIRIFPPSRKKPQIPGVPPSVKGKPFKRKITGDGYNAFVRRVRARVRKKQKFREFLKINKKPLTKERAKDAMAYLIDHSLASKGKIVKTSGTPKKLQLNIPKGYYKNKMDKFREYKIRKRKRIPTPNKFIEKRGKPRLDTVGEKRKIKAFGQLQRLRKQHLAAFPKLKSTFGLRRKK